MRSYRIEPTKSTYGLQHPVWSVTARSVIINNISSNHNDISRSSAERRYESLKMNSMPVEVSRHSGANLMESAGSFHRAIRPIIIMAQCFAVFPVCGVTSSDANDLKFTWRSLKIVYSFLSIMGSIVLTMFSVYRLATTSITSSKTSNLVFFSTAGLSTFLFMRLARDWPSLAVSWENMERELVARHNPRRPSCGPVNLGLKFKILSVVIMSLALVEHSLSILSGIFSALECASIRGDTDLFRTYFALQFPQMINDLNYTLWRGFAVQLVNILMTFTWNFMDLFLILMSVALTDQFRQLNHRLYSIKGKSMPEWWWAEARTDFNRLATMTRRVDTEISGIVLLSFSTNLYFICIQLLNSFK